MADHSRTRWSLALPVLIMLVVVVVYSVRLPQRELRPYTWTGFAMGTLVEITVYANRSAEGAVNKGFDRIGEIEQLVSTSISDSDIALLNSAPIGSYVQVHEDTAYLISSALEFARETRGSFDPTVGRLVDLWGIGTERASVPSGEAIRYALSGVGYQNLVLDEDKRQVMRNTDFRVDLGAIAKGYACDEVVGILQNAGIDAGIVDLGGNICVFGTKPTGQQWRVGIQDPAAPRGSYVGVISISSGAVATSGDYERYFERDSVIYHHILDPSTGYPASPGVRSVSVIAPTGIQADALSTGLFVLGVDELFEFVDRSEEIEVVVITSDNRVIVSSGIAEAFQVVKEGYTYEIR